MMQQRCLHNLTCGRGIGNNSIQCTTNYQKWVYRKCSDIKGSMYKVMKTFVCRVA